MKKQNPEGFNVIRVPYWTTDKLGSRAAKIDTSEEESEALLEAFLHEMQSISEPGEIDFPEFIDEFHHEVDSDAFTLFWDGGGYNNGGYSVWRVGPHYFCNMEGTFGPFSTLMETLKCNEIMHTVTSATESITSSELTADELAKVLCAWDDIEQGFQLQINNETWELNPHGTWTAVNSGKNQMGKVITFLKRIPEEDRASIVGRAWGNFARRRHFMHTEGARMRQSGSSESDIQKVMEGLRWSGSSQQDSLSRGKELGVPIDDDVVIDLGSRRGSE